MYTWELDIQNQCVAVVIPHSLLASCTHMDVLVAYIYIYVYIYIHYTYIYLRNYITYAYTYMLNRFYSCVGWHSSCIVYVGHAGRLLWWTLCIHSHFTHMIWDCVRSEWTMNWMRASMKLLNQLLPSDCHTSAAMTNIVLVAMCNGTT